MRGTIQKRQSSWRVRVETGRDPVTGRRRWLTATTATRKEAEMICSRFVAQTAGRQTGTWAGTVGEALEHWWDYAKADFRPNTKDTTRRALDNHLVPALGRVRLDRLTAADLDRFYAELRQAGRAPATIRRIHGIAHRMLADAVRWGWVPTNVASSARPPRVPKRRRTEPDGAEVRALIRAATDWDCDFGCFVRLAAASGARRAELCALRWSDVDLDRQQLRLLRALSGGEEGERKESNETAMALDAGTVAALRQMRARQRATAMQCGAGMDVDPFVFSLDPRGARPWTPTLASHRFGRVRRLAGVERVRLHDLRHFSASALLDAGVPATTVSERLGHASTHTTLTVYAHAVNASDQRAADVLGGLLDLDNEADGQEETS